VLVFVQLAAKLPELVGELAESGVDLFFGGTVFHWCVSSRYRDPILPRGVPVE
jgi:hypothetical protein